MDFADEILRAEQQGADMQVEGAARELPIGEVQLRDAMELFQKYKAGKANLDARIIEDEEWFRLRHWAALRKNRKDENGNDIPEEVEPTSAWLLDSILSKHADGMDNYPRPNIVPREEGDVSEAKILSSIVPVIFDHIGFEEIYSRALYPKLKHGTSVYGVFWDATAAGGLGEITVKDVDVLNLFWEPSITDIQDSQNIFLVTLYDNKLLEGMYPQLRGKLGGRNVAVGEYIHDDSINTAEKSAVIDWYYKKTVGGKTVLHFCKFINTEVLYATENDPQAAERGLYDHGKYPFVLDILIPCEGTPAGFGYIDIGKSPQEYIDRGSQAVMENMLDGSSSRYFGSEAAGINEGELLDRKKKVVHYTGDPNAIQPLQTKPLSAIYLNVLTGKVEELKEVTGNRDVSNGGTTSGVTTASGIAAMQEAGGKRSRDSNKGTYRAFRRIVELVIELIRQFYDTPHYFRVVGDGGAETFIRYSNEKIKPQPAGIDSDGQPVYRSPVFDIEISAEKQSPYSRLAQNEMALQFLNAGFFNPQNADASLACLDMMDFDRKDMVMQKIMRNGTLYQKLIQLQQMAFALAQTVDASSGTNYSAMVAQIAPELAASGGAGRISGQRTPVTDGQSRTPVPTADGAEGESHVTRKARERSAATTSPV
ncbi:MAG: hypothetical protein E7589_01310 [Ruminococcaceae bacterium]|nr:hypothetical protein [Oscillospiraceae bacterium]